jgi:sucrose phosphorylase
MEHLVETIGVVHVLPFSPSSSDRGFSVIDYTSVDPGLGTWGDIESLAATVDLMADLVCNHTSADSSWFRQFVANEPLGRDYFITVDAHADTSTVVRPRTLPLIQAVQTQAGPRHVWCTFSHDQADLDYSNPDVLLEMLRVLDLYITAGARFIRLDAVAYLWKQLGTPCIHLPQTHEVIRLWRTLLHQRASHVGLITETNVPVEENLSYFGTGDEAHLIYNFTLPPLVIDALLRGRSDHLTSWMQAMPPAPEGCAYLNFLASHDGIGLRPAAGLLSQGEINGLVATTEASGGLHGTYTTPDGPLPYELNIALWDLLSGTATNPADGAQVDRFVCAHAIMFGLAGIPALYVNSLFAQPSDADGAAASGVRRDINRSGVELGAALALLEDPTTAQGEAIARLLGLLGTRGAQSAFHPNANQSAIDLGKHLVGFRRSAADGVQTILAISNCTAHDVTVAFNDLPALDAATPWHDLIAGGLIDLAARGLVLTPYQTVWMTNTDVDTG